MEKIQFTAEEAAQVTAPKSDTQPDTKTGTEQPSGEPQNNQQPPTTETPQRPDWCPEKFWKDGKVDTEGLAKSYGELEKKSSQPADKKDGEQTPPADQQAKPEEAFKPFFDEFAANGKLSDESFKALEAKGLPRSVVEEYITLQRGKLEADTKSIYDAAGGEQGYKELVQWAGHNLPPAEINAFNKVLESGDVAQIRLATQGLHVRFTEATGKSGARIRGSGSGAAVAPFASADEITRAMSDPRYKTDSAYRNEVARRVAISDVL